ncbi:SHOCT domain-containing protein [Geodermatophilus sp. SYSU D00758]
MPGLLRGVARTAVVAGTATAVSNRVSRRQAGRWAARDAARQPAAPPPAYAEPAYQQPAYQQSAPPPPPAGTGTDARLAQLRELGQLHEAGVLTDEEFAQQKSRILGS